MRDSGDHDAAIEDEVVTLAMEHFFELRVRGGFVPTLTEQSAAVGEGLIHVRVSRHDRVADERDVWRDAHLHQQHEELAESRQARSRVADELLRMPAAG